MRPILIILGALLSSSLEAAAPPIYAHCGAKPGFFEKFLTDAEEIRIKCINDAFEANKRRTIEEANQLDVVQKQLKAEIDKVAYTSTLTMVRCDPPQGEPKNPARTAKCRELNQARNAVIERIDVLMGWNERPMSANQINTTIPQITPPCPPRDDLARIQAARHFNRRLFETWERCVQLQPENFYN
jgi:hypothetical protein